MDRATWSQATGGAVRPRGAGWTGVLFLEDVDGELAPTERPGPGGEVIRRHTSGVVLGHDPWKRYRLHPDHRAAGRLCVDGIVAARTRSSTRAARRHVVTPPDALLLFEPDEINHHETVERSDVAAKWQPRGALDQMETTHFYRVPEGDLLERIRPAAASSALGGDPAGPRPTARGRGVPPARRAALKRRPFQPGGSAAGRGCPVFAAPMPSTGSVGAYRPRPARCPVRGPACDRRARRGGGPRARPPGAKSSGSTRSRIRSSRSVSSPSCGRVGPP